MSEIDEILSKLTPESQKEARSIFDERVAIMINDGNASQEDAEREGIQDVKRWLDGLTKSEA